MECAWRGLRGSARRVSAQRAQPRSKFGGAQALSTMAPARFGSPEQLSDARKTEASKVHMAARGPVGSRDIIGAVLGKMGTITHRMHGDDVHGTMVMGGACAEVLSGPRLAKALTPAVEMQEEALFRMSRGEPHEPLSIHTSVGLPVAVGGFVAELQKHLPWPDVHKDWFVNFQLEGTTAVWAGVEALGHIKQVQDDRREHRVALGSRSYHGPKSTGLGFPTQARFPGAPRTQGQVPYPLPQDCVSHAAWRREFDRFLEDNPNVSIIVFEPQWGSSFAGMAWPKELLQEAVQKCKARDIMVMCDEIMCGLGRHGQGDLFLSKSWGLEPDAVTFGKAVASGSYPLSGVAIKKGSKALGKDGVKVVQSHTYSGSSSMAFLTATEVLKELPNWFDHARRMGGLVEDMLRDVNDGKFLQMKGQGLMWGGIFLEHDHDRRQHALALFREECIVEGVWPYFVPVGFMMSPPMDIEESEFREGLTRLRKALEVVRDKMKAQ